MTPMERRLSGIEEQLRMLNAWLRNEPTDAEVEEAVELLIEDCLYPKWWSE